MSADPPSRHPLPPGVDTGPLRPAVPDDIPGLARLWALAFPGERTPEVRARELEEGGAWGGWEGCWVAGEGGRIDGALRTLPLTLHLFGLPVPTLGVAAVAVAPHARRRGLAGSMCRAALRIGRARGDLLSALYPFRADFYARLGYGLAGALERYRFPPEALPLFPGAQDVVRLEDPAARLPAYHHQVAPRVHGHLARSERRWGDLLGGYPLAFGVFSSGAGAGSTGEGVAGGAGETGLPGERAGRAGSSPTGGADRLEGYLLGKVRRLPRGGGIGFEVAELLASTPDAYRALLGWLSAQRDAWREITFDALPGERLHQVLSHPKLPGKGTARSLWFPSATLLRGPMVRILHPGALLEALQADPGATLSLHDEALPENTGRWMEGREGWTRGTAEPGDGALPVALASSLLVEGGLPGVALPRPGFDPLLGVPEFRLLDPF